MEFIKSALILCSLFVTGLAQKPVLSVEPRSSIVKLDETVTFRCNVVSGSQPVQLEWKRPNNQPLGDNVKVDPDGSVLTISLARPGNQGPYRCIATNAKGRTTITATLLVKQPPKVQVTPTNPTVRVGGTASLECHASGRPRPSITWFKQEAGRETSLLSTTTDASVLLKVTAQDAGVFVCRAQNVEGIAEEKVVLKVMGGASMGTEPKAFVSVTDISAVEGQTVTMQCQATGTPTPVISWSKLRAPLPWLHKAEGGSLILSKVGRQDSGQYICNATNAVGYSEAYVQMEVETPPYATTVPDRVSARRGDPLRLQCIAHGSYPISYVWTRMGRNAMSPAVKITKEGVLTIPQLKASDSGTYKCIASNHLGSSEATATVAVKA